MNTSILAFQLLQATSVVPRNLYLGLNGLTDDPPAEARLHLHPLQTVGAASGIFCAWNVDSDLPLDQRIDDGRSLCFDSFPLSGAVEILGKPSVTLDISVDRPIAHLAIRLNDVAEDGRSRRVSLGILNLCHRDGTAAPEPLTPGRRYTVEVPLDCIAHRFDSGRRIRVAISTTYWPFILPAPEPVVLTLYSGRARLTLPIRPCARDEPTLTPFAPALIPPMGLQVTKEYSPTCCFEYDAIERRQIVRRSFGQPDFYFPSIDTHARLDMQLRYSINENHPSGAVAEAVTTLSLERQEWRPRVETVVRIVAASDEFLLEADLVARDGDEVVGRRRWRHVVPRQLV